MSDPSKLLDCGQHGERCATFVCHHLAYGSGLGFFHAFDAENPDDPWPDAWCAECDRVLMEEGEWNERSEAFAKITAICSGCYERARERNRKS